MSDGNWRAHATGFAVGLVVGLALATCWFLLIAPGDPARASGAPPSAAAATGAAPDVASVSGREVEAGARLARPAPPRRTGEPAAAVAPRAGTSAGAERNPEQPRIGEEAPVPAAVPSPPVTAAAEEEAVTEDEPGAEPAAESEEESSARSEAAQVREHERALREQLSEELVIHVTDAETGDPMKGVEVSIFLGTFQGGGVSGGKQTDATGTATFDPKGWLGSLHPYAVPTGSASDPLLAVVRIRVPGYKPFGAQAVGDRLEARLERDTAPTEFGTLQGVLLDPDGQAWARTVVISLQDPIILDQIEASISGGQDGRFELSGVPAGRWGVKIGTSWGARTPVEIPAGGAAEVVLRLSEEQARRSGDATELARPVTVTVAGRDLPYGAAILLEGEWPAPYMNQLAGGVAHFAAVPVGWVRVRLRRPDATDELMPAIIPEGEGVLEIPFTSAR